MDSTHLDNPWGLVTLVVVISDIDLRGTLTGIDLSGTLTVENPRRGQSYLIQLKAKLSYVV